MIHFLLFSLFFMGCAPTAEYGMGPQPAPKPVVPMEEGCDMAPEEGDGGMGGEAPSDADAATKAGGGAIEDEEAWPTA